MSGLRSWTGREFHRRGPAAAKVLSPWLLSIRSTTQVESSADLILCLLDTIKSSANTAEPIEMLFGLWAHWGSWNHVLGAGLDPSMGRGNYSGSSPIAVVLVRSTVQRHQSAERLILCQISSLVYPKIQRRRVIMNVLHPGCAWPPRWSPPVLCRRFRDARCKIWGISAANLSCSVVGSSDVGFHCRYWWKNISSHINYFKTISWSLC